MCNRKNILLTDKMCRNLESIKLLISFFTGHSVTECFVQNNVHPRLLYNEIVDMIQNSDFILPIFENKIQCNTPTCVSLVITRVN